MGPVKKAVSRRASVKMMAVNGAKLQHDLRNAKALINEADHLLALYAPGTGPVLDKYLIAYEKVMGCNSAIIDGREE